MNACARPAYVRHGEQKLVIFGKKWQICKKRPNLRMIKRSPFCSLDNAWFIVSNHGTSEIRQSSLTSLKVWTVFLLVLPILFLTTFKLEPNHFETVQEVENVNVPNIIALEPANIISLFFNCFVLTIPVVQPPQLCCLVRAPSVGKNNSMVAQENASCVLWRARARRAVVIVKSNFRRFRLLCARTWKQRGGRTLSIIWATPQSRSSWTA